MTRPPTLLALCISLALGTAQAAPDADLGAVIPRVSCDLLDVRSTAVGPSADLTGPGEGLPGGGPTIRQVGGLDLAARRTSSASEHRDGFLRVGLGPSAGQAPSVVMELGPRNVSITPGTTALIEIAIDHLNRLVTPFANPVVRTVSAASTSVDGHVVYVATSTEEPVSLYISDGQSDDLALSLTLAPRYVPPREIRLTVPGYRGKGASGGGPDVGKSASLPGTAGEGNGSIPYVAALTDLLRAMAQRRLPAGFQVKGRGPKAHCAPGLKIIKTQLIQGATAGVLTLGVRNAGTGTVPVNESACDLDQGIVAAVGAWPLKDLAPGQETEVFLVLQEGSVATDPSGTLR
jgi:conjugal transfer pilus assembly protein TraK